MEWKQLISLEQIAEINKESNNEPVIIFKHSTRCSTSSMVLNRFERQWNLKITPYFLDLIKLRPISNELATVYGVEHESPQVLMIKDGKCVYNASHTSISVEDIKSFL